MQGLCCRLWCYFNGPKSQFLFFKGKEYQSTNCQIVVNNERLNNITSAVHLRHCLSKLNKNSLIDAACAQFWKGFNISTHSGNVGCLISIVVASMEHHYGILYIIITFVLLGEKHLEKCGVYRI